MALFALLNSLNSVQATLQTNLLISLLTQMTEVMETWPFAIVNYGLNDSLSVRNWVDRTNATQLLQCICAFFGGLLFPSEVSCQACDLPYIQREQFKEVCLY